MARVATLDLVGAEAAKLTVADSPARVAWRRFQRHRAAMSGAVIVISFVLIALLGPLAIPADNAFRPNIRAMNRPPSISNALGTDEVGRDILARLIYAGRVSLTVGFLSMAIAITVGATVGSLSGYYTGVVDSILMRFTDLMLSIPPIFLLIVLAVFFGPSLPTIIIVIGLLSWMRVARVIRATVLSLKEKEFIEGARCLGATDLAIITRHILPNTLAPIIVAATLGVGAAMLTETAISYLGLGVQPPTPSWGNMLLNAQDQMWTAPWVAIFPGLMILITVLNINFVGDGLRDAFDPRGGG